MNSTTGLDNVNKDPKRQRVYWYTDSYLLLSGIKKIISESTGTGTTKTDRPDVAIAEILSRHTAISCDIHYSTPIAHYINTASSLSDDDEVQLYLDRALHLWDFATKEHSPTIKWNPKSITTLLRCIHKYFLNNEISNRSSRSLLYNDSIFKMANRVYAKSDGKNSVHASLYLRILSYEVAPLMKTARSNSPNMTKRELISPGEVLNTPHSRITQIYTNAMAGPSPASKPPPHQTSSKSMNVSKFKDPPLLYAYMKASIKCLRSHKDCHDTVYRTVIKAIKNTPLPSLDEKTGSSVLDFMLHYESISVRNNSAKQKWFYNELAQMAYGFMQNGSASAYFVLKSARVARVTEWRDWVAVLEKRNNGEPLNGSGIAKQLVLLESGAKSGKSYALH